MRHSYYGDLQGEFAGEGKELFKRAWGLWVLAPFALILFPAFPFLYATFKAIEWRWWLSGIRFGGVRLESKLERGTLIHLYWKVIGWYLLASLALAICAGIITGLSGGDAAAPAAALTKNVPLLVMTVIGYLCLILSLNVVVRVYLLRDVWVTVLRSVQVYNIGAAANVTARGELASALGEGFADGLDVAGF
jgi:hypothetical protein